MKLLLSAASFAALSLSACAVPQASAYTPGATGGQTDPGDLKAFPAATAGQTRHVINLPQLADESASKVELIVGKTMQIDCNHHFFGGSLETRTAQGWGYDYYVLENLGAGATTLKGCPAGSERTAFVRSSTETLVRYNSRLPLVVYTPKDVELRYRLWTAQDEQRL